MSRSRWWCTSSCAQRDAIVADSARLTGAKAVGSFSRKSALFRVDPAKEAEALVTGRQHHVEPLETRTLVVDNPNLANVAVSCVTVYPLTTVLRILIAQVLALTLVY